MTTKTTRTILITGANRGIGLELTRQYLRDGGWMIEACCRNPGDAADLRRLADGSEGRVRVHRLEVTDAGQIASLAKTLSGRPIDILLNNAGVMGSRQQLGGPLDEKTWLDIFRVNTIAPVRIAQALLENVATSERRIIASMTSRMGSIDDNTSGGHYYYRTSKAALNMAMRSLAVDLKNRGVTVVVLHPGWVKTAMGGDSAPLSVEQSVSGLREVLSSLAPGRSGRFIAFDGAEIPW